MNRTQVEALLRYRWALTEQTFGEPKIDAWHNVLQRFDFDRMRDRVTVLVAQGATKVELGQLTAGIQRPEPERTLEPEGEYIPWSDPRAQRAFKRGYLEATGREYAG